MANKQIADVKIQAMSKEVSASFWPRQHRLCEASEAGLLGVGGIRFPPIGGGAFGVSLDQRDCSEGFAPNNSSMLLVSRVSCRPSSRGALPPATISKSLLTFEQHTRVTSPLFSGLLFLLLYYPQSSYPPI